MKIFNKSEWKKVKLGDVCDILDSKRIPISEEKRIKGEYPYYGANGIQGYINDYIFDEELVLLAEDGGNFGSKTKPIAYKISGKTWVNNHAHVLKAKDEIISTDFLLYSLMFYDVTKLITGTTRKKLTRAGMEKITIYIPTLSIQNKITDYLNKIENFISFREHQLSFLKELNKSLFTTMFGDIKTNDKNWEIKKLKELVEIKSFIINENLNSIWLLNLEDIEPNTGKLIKKREVSFKNIPSSTISFNENYVLYSKLRPYLNKVFLPDEKGFGTSELVPLLPKKNIHKIFLTEYLRNDKIVDFLSQKVSGAKMPRVIMKEFQDLNLIFPPIELQNKFAERIEKIEKLKFEIEKSIEEAQKLYDSLIYKYFDN